MKKYLSSLGRSLYVRAFIAAVGWQIIMTLIGWFVSGGDSQSLLDHMFRWDSGWYLTIIHNHYQTNDASAAFYPLFPLTVSTVSFLSFGFLSLVAAALLINTVSVWLIIIALIKIAEFFLPRKFHLLPVLFLFLSPAAFFMHMFYSEALFTAIALCAYLFALQRRWWLCGALLGILTAGRLPALLFVGLCGLEYLRSYGWNIKEAINKHILAFILAPLGFVAYGSYLAATTGSFFGMFEAYKKTTDWIYQVFNPNIFEPIARATYASLRGIVGLRPIDNDLIVNNIIPLACLSLLIAGAFYYLFVSKKRNIPLGAFGLAAVIMFTLNSNVVSVHRYTLPCIVIYLFLSSVFVDHPKIRPYIVCLAVLLMVMQTYLYIAILHGYFAG
jgi:hypothetical protein